MKAHLAKVSLALLSVVFVLGCQDVGTGPDGLVPQFDKPGVPNVPGGCGGGVDRDDKGHCHADDPVSDPDDATYKANFVAGPLISVGDIKFAAGAKFNSGGPGQNSVLIDLRSFETLFGDLGCFDNDSFTAGEGDDEGDIATGPFGIQVKRNNPNSAVVGFWFFAQGTDGSTVSYVVHVPGTMPSWPPTIGNSVPITGDGTYEMGHNNGPGNGVACKGTGSVDYSLLVTRIT